MVQLHARTAAGQYRPGGANSGFVPIGWVLRKKKSALESMAGDSVQRKLKFGPFELSSGERVLQRDGVMLPLGSRALDILIYLAERPGEVVTKKELIDHVWPDVVVEEGSLRVHIAAIRKALRDGKLGNRYIANIQGRGYSFVASVVGADNRVPLERPTQGDLPIDRRWR